jgi:hypothetical protein
MEDFLSDLPSNALVGPKVEAMLHCGLAGRLD